MSAPAGSPTTTASGATHRVGSIGSRAIPSARPSTTTAVGTAIRVSVGSGTREASLLRHTSTGTGAPAIPPGFPTATTSASTVTIAPTASGPASMDASVATGIPSMTGSSAPFVMSDIAGSIRTTSTVAVWAATGIVRMASSPLTPEASNAIASILLATDRKRFVSAGAATVVTETSTCRMSPPSSSAKGICRRTFATECW